MQESLLSHGAMCQALDQQRHSQRWQRALRRPWRPLLRRCGIEFQSDPQAEFIELRGWPTEVKKTLRRLPAGFISSYSLHPDAGLWVYNYVLEHSPRGVLELGCGISTVLIALALRAKSVKEPFFSLEGESVWLEKTRAALKCLDLDSRVELRHAPIKPFDSGTIHSPIHDFSEFGSLQAEMFLVDAPPGNIGRAGALPRFLPQLAPGACLILDDAEREGELSVTQQWCTAGLAKLNGFLSIGRGLALLTVKK